LKWRIGLDLYTLLQALCAGRRNFLTVRDERDVIVFQGIFCRPAFVQGKKSPYGQWS
jgi:hypothetical protein